MKDPYQILGVPPNATDAEIKKAYRELAKKYHPDTYRDNPLADLAEERMKEINEAYDIITKQRSEGFTPPDPDSSSGRTGEYNQVRILINNGMHEEADAVLNSVSQSERNAEWNYLKGCVLTRRGWYYDAQKYIEIACYLDPNNTEYRNALNAIRQSTVGYSRVSLNRGCSPCSICTGLICMDCLCECCGSDCINCS